MTLQAEAPPLAALLKRYAPKDAAALAAWIGIFLVIVQIVMGCQQQTPQVTVKDIDRITIRASHQDSGSSARKPR